MPTSAAGGPLASVGGEKGRRARLGLSLELGVGERPVPAEQALVERAPEDQEREVGGRDERVAELQQPAAGELLETSGQGADRPLGRTLVVRARQVRELRGGSDHHPAQLEYHRLGHRGQVPAREPPQILGQIPGFRQRGDLGPERVAGAVERAQDDLGEQLLLVGEEPVDGRLGDRRECGDLVHARAEVPVPQEQGRRRLDDGAPLAGRPVLDHRCPAPSAGPARCAGPAPPRWAVRWAGDPAGWGHGSTVPYILNGLVP